MGLPQGVCAAARAAGPLTSRPTFYRTPQTNREEAFMTIRNLLKSKGSYVPSIRSNERRELAEDGRSRKAPTLADRVH
jgi:hypothetical protein